MAVRALFAKVRRVTSAVTFGLPSRSLPIQDRYFRNTGCLPMSRNRHAVPVVRRHICPVWFPGSHYAGNKDPGPPRRLRWAYPREFHRWTGAGRSGFGYPTARVLFLSAVRRSRLSATISGRCAVACTGMLSRRALGGVRRQGRLDIQVAEERKDLLVGVSLFLEIVDCSRMDSARGCSGDPERARSRLMRMIFFLPA